MNLALKLFCLFLLSFATSITTNGQGFNFGSKKKPIAELSKDTITQQLPLNGILNNNQINDTLVKPQKRVDTTIIRGFNADNKRSIRSLSAFDSETISNKRNNEALVLDYQKLREEDALFSEYVWEEIDAREKINRTFIYNSYDQSEDQRFFAILMRAIEKDEVLPFSPIDDRFTTPMTPDELNASMYGKIEQTFTKNVFDQNVLDTVLKYNKDFEPDSIYTFRLKVQWIFDSKTSRMYSRIIGIAPVYTEKINNKISKRTLFWVHYKDLRPTLVKNNVYNPKNMTSRITWDELFESRYFNSYIVKTTIDNYNDKLLNALYKDPVKRLQEGEKIKQKIFEFEQDRWVY